MKLSNQDLYFVVAYYLEELNGSYPLVQTVDGKTDETMSYLLRHYLHSILKLNHTGMEMQVINLLRNEKSSEIIRTAFATFPAWRQRSDSHERILFVAKQLLKIQALNRNHHQENESKKDLSTNTKYSSIEDYEATIGKRFRMKKEQKARGLSREEAFKELYGGG